MGIYINPGNSGFTEINNSEYIDKTMLIDLVSQTIGKTNKLTCVSRPRRFGKSFAAKMLTAYYDRSCDSHGLFDDKKIAGTADYEKHLNRYNVIYLEITSFISQARQEHVSIQEVPGMIKRALWKDLKEAGFPFEDGDTLNDYLIRCAGGPDGKQFVFIIDEWDAVIREAKDDLKAQKLFLDLLREWFKNGTFTPKAVAAAYMTGILPIKKDGSQSAISDFREYTMLRPRKYCEFVGFTEKDVRNVCEKRDIDFQEMKRWY
ncbi:MAG: AAA family ATPase, partial [Lachnospiraceae bacterium]|nr:AAA family ATPase [Lachnospiraceae bacterium]